MPDDEERKRGILSNADRNYLRNPDQYAEDHHRQSVIERREAIQSRVKNAVFDFPILFDHLPEKDLQQICRPSTETFEMADGEELSGDGFPITGHLQFGIAFIARAADLDNKTIVPQNGIDQPALANLTEHIEHGVRHWLADEKQIVADVDVEIRLSDAQSTEAMRDEIKEQAGNESGRLTPFEQVRLRAAGFTDEDIEAIRTARHQNNDTN